MLAGAGVRCFGRREHAAEGRMPQHKRKTPGAFETASAVRAYLNPYNSARLATPSGSVMPPSRLHATVNGVTAGFYATFIALITFVSNGTSTHLPEFIASVGLPIALGMLWESA